MKPSATRPDPRFFVATGLCAGAEIRLPERAARHCAVLRLRSGDSITLFNGEGGEFAAEIARFSRDGALARVISGRSIERESPLSITLAQCVSSGDRMDLALQKSTELGVARIVPIASVRSVVHLTSERADRRLEHWRNVVIAACEQCGRNRIPEVEGIVEIGAFLSSASVGTGTRLLLAPEAPRRLNQLERATVVTLLIGPEGGLAPEEHRHAESSGFVPISFGTRVLRTETAPLAAIAAMQAMWGDC
jgi:16S rRNA (uracil1498-N3)-methyltransferase